MSDDLSPAITVSVTLHRKLMVISSTGDGGRSPPPVEVRNVLLKALHTAEIWVGQDAALKAAAEATK